MKQIRVEDAAGCILCHDITRIIPGVTKDAVFRKGHKVCSEDIPVLLSIGKEHLYVWETQEGMLHENDAAEILREISQGEHMHPSEVKEGKIELIADCDGLLKVDAGKVNRVNALGEMMIACRHGNFPVKKGDRIAGMRVIPLVIEKEKMVRAEKAAGKGPAFNILPFKKMAAGIVTTGSEVYNGRIKDQFTPVVVRKLEEYGVNILPPVLCRDDPSMIEEAVCNLHEKGAQMIVCTGGMSVDPDDRTPLAIRNCADQVITYGAPVLPGAMFMLAYRNGIPLMGLPGCVMYAKRTVFDLVLPRVIAGERLKSQDFKYMGQGGLCLSCEVCTFPNCSFGKGANEYESVL